MLAITLSIDMFCDLAMDLMSSEPARSPKTSFSSLYSISGMNTGSSFLFSLDEIEDYMNLCVEGILISEERSVLRINSQNTTVVLDLPYSELLDVELPTPEIQSCLLGCRCEDLSYLTVLKSCLDSVGGPYLFSFDQAVGCSDSAFELPIFVSKQNNTLSIAYPIPLENGSLFKFSC